MTHHETHEAMTEHGSLADEILRHQVVYEVSPARVAAKGKLQVVGYDVSLIGTHGPVEGPVHPGCEYCVEVFHALSELAHKVLPDRERESTFHVLRFTGGLHYDPQRGKRADVELVIEIRHRADYNHVVDECEESCLEIILRNLRALGVPERRWKQGAQIPGAAS